jgi:hypothetical protein
MLPQLMALLVAERLLAGAGSAPASTVTVLTDVASVTRNFVPIPSPVPAPPFNIPIGTVVAFSGTAADAESQKTNGWWVCDGRLVSDPRADARFLGKSTPDLKSKFLRGDAAAGILAGQDAFHIPNQTITVSTNGHWGGRDLVNTAPETGMHLGDTSRKGNLRALRTH